MYRVFLFFSFFFGMSGFETIRCPHLQNDSTITAATFPMDGLFQTLKIEKRTSQKVHDKFLDMGQTYLPSIRLAPIKHNVHTKNMHKYIPVSNVDSLFYEIITVEIYVWQASLPFVAHGVQKGYKGYNRTKESKKTETFECNICEVPCEVTLLGNTNENRDLSH